MSTAEHSPIIPDDDTDQDMEALIASMKEAFRFTEQVADELNELYQAGDMETLEERLDERVYEALERSAEYRDNLARLTEMRRSRTASDSEKRAIIDRNKELYAEMRMIFINEAGLPDASREAQVSAARDAIAERLQGAFPDGYTPKQALEQLDIIHQDGDTTTYRFPEELVPPSTQELWETYLAAVLSHVQTERALRESFITDKAAVMDADQSRTWAHNAVTKELHSILNFDETAWQNADTRQLLAKIRDQVFPTYESAVSEAGKAFVDSHQASLQAVATLCSKTHKG